MAVSVAKGAMRLVGGQLSHAGEATVNAGNATIGIRGGTGIFTTKEVINLNGTLTPNNCPPVKRPGYKISLSCGPIQQASAAELSHYVNLFTSRFGQNGGVRGLTNAQLNGLGITPRWYPPTPSTLPTGANPDNVPGPSGAARHPARSIATAATSTAAAATLYLGCPPEIRACLIS